MGRPRKTGKNLPKYVTIIHGSYWYAAPKQKRVRICEKGDDAALYRFLLDKTQPSGPATTMLDVLDRYEREIVPTLQPRTQADYRRHLKVLRGFCGHMGPNDLQPRDIGRFLDVPKGRIHRNKIIGVLSAVYTYAVGRWYEADRNPCLGVMRNPTKARQRYITDAELDAFKAILPERHRIAVDLALITGQRQGDLLSLKWAQVTDEGITFQQGKTGKRLRVKMSPALEAVLKRAKALTPEIPREYVLRSRKGKRYRSEGFRAVWQRAMAKATKGYTKFGVAYPPVLAERFTFHDIRAKSVSDSKSLQEAMERAGHTSMAMTRGVYDRGTRDVEPLK